MTAGYAMTDLRLLEREMYAEAEAARLLDVAPGTLHYWLEGKTGRAGKVHRPVIRQEPKGTRGRWDQHRGDLGALRGR